MVDFLLERKINMLFTIGGDGTQRGALALTREIEKRGLAVSVVGIPKTIDNDIQFTERTFGFETAVGISPASFRLNSSGEWGVPMVTTHLPPLCSSVTLTRAVNGSFKADAAAAETSLPLSSLSDCTRS